MKIVEIDNKIATNDNILEKLLTYFCQSKLNNNKMIFQGTNTISIKKYSSEYLGLAVLDSNSFNFSHITIQNLLPKRIILLFINVLSIERIKDCLLIYQPVIERACPAIERALPCIESFQSSVGFFQSCTFRAMPVRYILTPCIERAMPCIERANKTRGFLRFVLLISLPFIERVIKSRGRILKIQEFL